MSESQALALFPDDVTQLDAVSIRLRAQSRIFARSRKIARVKNAIVELLSAIVALFN